jgi:hypothetical protein
MSDANGNDHHGPLKLNLTEDEGESAREVIATLVGEAEELGEGVLARVWRMEADELAKLCLTDPEPEDSVIPCACCGKPADEIGEHGLPVCVVCGIGEREAILRAPGGLYELRPLIHDRYTFCLLSGRALTVMDAHQLAMSGELRAICGIGPRRGAEIDAALRQHREGGRS